MSGRLTKTFLRLLNAVHWCNSEPENAAKHLKTGRRGEDEVYFFLRREGYVIVARNWRAPGRHSDIDLIGWDGDVLCFIEVKTRTTREVASAEVAVDKEKRRQLSGMARRYMSKLSGARRLSQPIPHRFDIVSVYYDGPAGHVANITLFRGAFSMA
jgi:putative endonuclease